MSTNPTSTRLTGLPRGLFASPLMASLFPFSLFFFVSESERPTEANEEKEQPSQMNHGDKMKVLAALDMLDAKLKTSGQFLTAPELEIYETALRVIGPID